MVRLMPLLGCHTRKYPSCGNPRPIDFAQSIIFLFRANLPTQSLRGTCFPATLPRDGSERVARQCRIDYAQGGEPFKFPILFFYKLSHKALIAVELP